MLNATMDQLTATMETADDGQGNLLVGLVIGPVALVAAILWFIHRYRATRSRAANRAQHEMLREIYRQRPEEKAVKDVTNQRYLRRGHI